MLIQVHNMEDNITKETFLEGSLPDCHTRGTFKKNKAANRCRYTGSVTPTYYSKEYGLALLPHLIKMLQDKPDVEFTPKGESISTLYQRIQRSFLYALDHLDEGGLVEDLRQRVVLRKTQIGVVLCFRQNSANYTKRVRAYVAVPKFGAFTVRDSTSVEWRARLGEFTDGESAELELKDGFFLGGDDITQVKSIIDMCYGTIEIIKLDPYTIHLKRVTTLG